jgi:phosphoribosylformylglycinamidine synthase
MGTYNSEVIVGLKEGVLDPEAETIKRSLERLGYDLKFIKSKKLFEIKLDAESEEDAKEKVNEMTKRLLANPTIHEYRVDIV